jgi:hypothetical protein
MNVRILLTAGASAIALAASVPAMAQTTELFGAGDTGSSKVYRDVFNCYAGYDPAVAANNFGIYDSATISPGNPANVLYPTGPFATCSQQSNPVITGFEPVDSAALAAYTSATPSAFGVPARTNTVAFLNDTYPDFANTPYPQIQFVGSDAYLSATQAQQASAADGDTANADRAYEIPVAATPVVLPTTGSSTYNLSTSNICRIFSGQLFIIPHVFIKELVVFADPNGTSFIFSDYLAQNCGAAYGFTAANGFPSTTPNWSAVFAHNKIKYVPQLPLVSKTGSGGVAAEIGNPSVLPQIGAAIGYVSPGFVAPQVTNVNATVADVNGASPIVNTTNVGCYANSNSVADYCAALTPSQIDQVALRVNTVITQASVPTYTPATFGQKLNDLLTSTASGGYPIVGFNFIDTYKCYSTTINPALGTPNSGSNLSYLLQNFYPNDLDSDPTTLLGGHGVDPILASSPVFNSLQGDDPVTGYGPFGEHGIQGAVIPGSGDAGCPSN